MKKAVSFLLIVVIFSGIIPACLFAQEMTTCYVECFSNLSDISCVKILKNGDNAYISEEDLAAVSGFSITGDMSFARRGMKGTYAFVDTNHVTINDFIEYDGQKWAPLESSCEKLLTKVNAVGNGLIFMGKETTPEELLSITDSWLMKSGLGKIIDTHNVAGNLGLIGAFLTDVACDWGNVIKRVTTIHKRELYEDIYADLINDEQYSASNVKKFSKINKAINMISASYLNNEYEMKPDEICELFAKYGLSDSDADAYKITSGINVLLDPVDSLYSAVAKNDAFKDTFMNDLKMDGFDVVTQLELYSYVDSIINCNETSANMLKYTYYSPKTGKIAKDINKYSKKEIEKIIEYHNTTEYLEGLALYLTEEFTTLTRESAISSLKELLMTAITKGDFGDALFIKIYQYGLKLVFDSLWEFDVSAAGEFAEKARILNDMQTFIYPLYLQYRCVPEYSINAKYVAMLYMKCAALNEKYLNKADRKEDSGFYDMYIKALVSVSDSDLTDVVKNQKINVPKGEETPGTDPGSEHGTNPDTHPDIGPNFDPELDKDIVSDSLNYYKNVVPIFGTVEPGWEHHIQLPKINKNAPGAKELNLKIYQEYESYYQGLLNGKEESAMYYITYEYDVQNNIVIIRIDFTVGWQYSEAFGEIDFFFYDIEHDKEITVSDVIKDMGFDEKEIRNHIKKYEQTDDFLEYANSEFVDIPEENFDTYEIIGIYINDDSVDINVDFKDSRGYSVNYSFKLDKEKILAVRM